MAIDADVLVILDTNAIHNDYAFTQTHLRAILSARSAGIRVALSEVTLLEHAAHYRKERDDVSVRLARLATDVAPLPRLNDEAVRQLLKDRAAAAGIEVLGIPSVPHASLVDRAVRGHKPFSADGKVGYRDALIWETVIQAARDEAVALITNDDDLGAKNLAAPLAEDLKNSPFPVTRFQSSHQFFDKVLAPKLKKLAALEGSLLAGAHGDAVQRLLADALPSFEASPSDLGLRGGPYIGVSVSPTRLLFASPHFTLLAVIAALLDDGDVRLSLEFRGLVDAVAEFWTQVGEDDYDRDWTDFVGLPVVISATAIAAQDLADLKSLAIDIVRRDAAVPEPGPLNH